MSAGVLKAASIASISAPSSDTTARPRLATTSTGEGTPVEVVAKRGLAVVSDDGALIEAIDAALSTPADIRRWRQYLADEQAEAAVYRDLAGRRTGEEREILLALAGAEGRHEAHWRNLLGEQVGRSRRGAIRTRVLALLARRFGSVFVLALAQRV